MVCRRCSRPASSVTSSAGWRPSRGGCRRRAGCCCAPSCGWRPPRCSSCTSATAYRGPPPRWPSPMLHFSGECDLTFSRGAVYDALCCSYMPHKAANWCNASGEPHSVSLPLQVYFGLHQHVCIHYGAPAGAARTCIQGRWRHGTDLPGGEPMRARGCLVDSAAHETRLAQLVKPTRRNLALARNCQLGPCEQLDL